ncbi:hypothetical protein M409DRAFT_17049 [Zasmidium cellare ATCC 36951]|uniref:Thioesterase domain-containing protein n=1 Tax=Zasmidium cellare ATCC 36951 TaxID=1080233 RepID=A0A6A6D161_ZASCE|nr:uncharacterized protein M409DRAFT_17049 [Zasmidium cellare ATCC 36951]KAF2173101.1 hypothetical protein M409DRAFT_17049 [Zasmidium cellare ATCC 36951]
MSKKILERFKDHFDPKEIAQAYKEDKPGHFTTTWFEDLEVVSAEQTSPTTGKLVYRFPVQAAYLNPTGSLHGGAIATIFDIGTSWLLFLIARDGFWSPTFGTTRTLNCTYLRPAMEGEWLRLECEIVHAGKRLCLLRGVMKRERDGAEVATAEHNKFNVDVEKM